MGQRLALLALSLTLGVATPSAASAQDTTSKPWSAFNAHERWVACEEHFKAGAYHGPLCKFQLLTHGWRLKATMLFGIPWIADNTRVEILAKEDDEWLCIGDNLDRRGNTALCQPMAPNREPQRPPPG